MIGLESYLGKQLQWIACELHNTDHPHIHIIIREIDLIQKKGFLIPKTRMIYESRKLASEIATDILDYRTKKELHQNLENLISKNTITMLDTRINTKQILGKTEISDLNPHQKKRLDYSISLNLASKNNFFVPKETFIKLKDNEQEINIKSQITRALQAAQKSIKKQKLIRYGKEQNN